MNTDNIGILCVFYSVQNDGKTCVKPITLATAEKESLQLEMRELWERVKKDYGEAIFKLAET